MGGNPFLGEGTVDLLAVLGGEAPVDRRHVLLQLLAPAYADQRHGSNRVAQDPVRCPAPSQTSIIAGEKLETP